jgi:uncharacterized protein (DUF1501 family)
MKDSFNPNRRGFLRLSAGLASLGMMSMGLGLSLGVSRAARAAPINDYKALVCVYLFGGNDGNNLIVPLDPARYALYQTVRGNLALTGNELLPPITSGGQSYALHYGLPEMNALYGAGKLAVVLNTGMLERPLTRAEYLQGLNVPSNLFSHSDQTMQAQTGQPTALGTGWGGRLLDSFGGSDSLAAISVSAPSLLLRGNSVQGNVVRPGTNLSLSGMNLWPASAGTARRQALNQMLGLDGGSPLRQAANQAMADGLQLADALKSNASLTELSTVFPGTSLGNQLKEVMRLIRLRAQTGTPGRQVFFCSLDGFDTHGAQDWQHWNLLSQLSAALSAFYQATVETGLAAQVTTFTQSEFGRTLQSNGGGSDHAWGNHQMVLGGAVHGGVYGDMPDFTPGSDDDANNRGVWIPKIATAQFGATLGRWFGATDEELAVAFPNLVHFPSSNVGFMG